MDGAGEGQALQHYEPSQLRRLRCFHMVRSIWLPTDLTLQAVTVVSGAVAAVVACSSQSMAVALIGPWLASSTLLYSIRSLEELWFDLPDDVRADRANGLLWIHGLPATGVCIAILLCLAMARSAGVVSPVSSSR